MGYKDQLKQILNQFNLLKDSLKNKIEEIRKSEKYSEEYKVQLINEAKEEAKATQDQLTKEALSLIQEAKNKILGERTTTEKDQNFDLKLSNTLKILEMVGADMKIEELNALIQPFKEDYTTMKILRAIFIKAGIEGINEIFGYDTVDSRIQALDELERILPHAFFGDIENANTLGVSIALNYISEV